VSVDNAVRSAGDDDLDGVVDTLSQSFFDDPVMAWSFPDLTVRPRRLDVLWRFVAGGIYLPGGASTTLPGHEAVALWRTPDDGGHEHFWAANGERFVTAMEGDLERMQAISEAMSQWHPTDPHWYLLALGVRPALQGRGLGSLILEHTLVEIDRRGDCAYLEATSPRSRVLYERYGFEATAEFAADGGPPMWSMWRTPGRLVGDAERPRPHRRP
jgi:ribosomal protein S18 acetylase RimI-like enzyme